MKFRKAKLKQVIMYKIKWLVWVIRGGYNKFKNKCC